MEKVETKTIQTEEITHNFYCDGCGTHLGSSDEYDDGYYEELGEFELTCYTPRGWYKLKKCLCHSCAQKFLGVYYNTLESLGFEPD